MLVMIAGLSIYFATQLKFEEDISKIIPADEKTDKLNFIFNNSKFLEKLVVRISLRDSSISNPEELMTACDSLVSKIEAKNFKPDTLFKDVNYKIADDIILNIYGILFNNLPLFLEEEDYKHIDSTLTKTAIDVTMQKNYKALMSPSGFAFKENILKDPLHLVPIVLKKLQSLQFDENYVINNGYLTTKDGKNLMLFVIPNASNGNTGRNHELIKLMDSYHEYRHHRIVFVYHFLFSKQKYFHTYFYSYLLWCDCFISYFVFIERVCISYCIGNRLHLIRYCHQYFATYFYTFQVAWHA